MAFKHYVDENLVYIGYHGAGKAEWHEISAALAGKCLKLENGSPVLDEIAQSEKEAADAIAATNQAWDDMRQERDNRLRACDYIIMPDYPMADKSAWETYRQALRDLPDNTSDINNINWPTEP